MKYENPNKSIIKKKLKQNVHIMEIPDFLHISAKNSSMRTLEK